ncbi:hypothetical protein ACFPH6_40225 [Streptomyces xiangluensis]|uniref:Uncharacterized protein n=1 Tax=Streptomyces xiangluensis TaxID=2665720 RepID=A0ABV8YZF6_9ACTN
MGEHLRGRFGRKQLLGVSGGENHSLGETGGLGGPPEEGGVGRRPGVGMIRSSNGRHCAVSGLVVAARMYETHPRT